MKKFSFLKNVIFIGALAFIASCGKDEDPIPTPTTPDACASANFPATTGNADVTFVNFAGTGTVNVEANAGDVLSIAVKINKASGERPQKLKVYESDCINTLGTVVNFSGQPQTEDGGNRIDLRNVDDQVRTVLYTVPTGKNPIYLNFEVDASGDKLTYKRMRINVSNSGIVDTYTGKTLGAQVNALPSRMSSSTGYVYLACETAANINTIDITYSSTGTDSYISSNPARFRAPIGLTAKSTNCGAEGTISTDGGNASYFALASGVDFNTVTDAQLSGLSVSASSDDFIKVSEGGVYAFLNAQGKKGLIKVTNIATGTGGTATIDIKVQR